MLIYLEPGSGREAVARLEATVRELGGSLRAQSDAGAGAWRIDGIPDARLDEALAMLPGVESALPVRHRLRHVLRREGEATAVVPLGRAALGGGGLTIVAGPCAVESVEQLRSVASSVASAGADALRGGAFKPRTSPYDFQGLGAAGVDALVEARRATGLPIVTEALDVSSLSVVAPDVDLIQIGARNMQNFSLLKAAGATGRPVLIKRGLAATLDDLLSAAEYVLESGASHVALCERGIRTFADHSRFTLDLSIVPVLQRRTRLPVIVDPSHACGDAASVAPLARAAAAVGADGVMIEVHPEPARARCDGRQALTPAAFAALVPQLRAIESLSGSGSPARAAS